MILIDNLRFLSLCLALTCLARPAWHFGSRSWTTWRAASCWIAGKSQNPEAEPEHGDSALWLSIDAIGLDAVVLYGDGEDNLSRAPVLHRDTGRVILISAHRDTHFKHLGNLKSGDDIVIEDRSGGERRYRVYGAETCDPAAAVARVHDSRDANILVLMTCYPFRYIGPAPDRFLVWAERV